MEIRVLIADDDAFVRRITARTLGGQPGIEVVGEAASAEEAVGLAEALEPDVVLLDVNMPGGGPAAARGIAQRCTNAVTVAFSASADSDVAAMTEAGASAYILKGTPVEKVAEGLRQAVSRREA